MKFSTKDKWQEYLLEQLPNRYGGYAVVIYNNKPELLYFSKHEYEGKPWVLEAPNFLRRFNITEREDTKSYEEHGFLIKDGYAYEIDTPQCSPFLPDEIDIVEVIGSSEGKAVDYLLNYDYKDADWKN